MLTDNPERAAVEKLLFQTAGKMSVSLFYEAFYTHCYFTKASGHMGEGAIYYNR